MKKTEDIVALREQAWTQYVEALASLADKDLKLEGLQRDREAQALLLHERSGAVEALDRVLGLTDAVPETTPEPDGGDEKVGPSPD